jgi:hypothetical protein
LLIMSERKLEMTIWRWKSELLAERFDAIVWWLGLQCSHVCFPNPIFLWGIVTRMDWFLEPARGAPLMNRTRSHVCCRKVDEAHICKPWRRCEGTGAVWWALLRILAWT